MTIRETLNRKNQDLKNDLQKIAGMVSTATIVPELEPYRVTFLAKIGRLLAMSQENLNLLATGQESLIADVLSETSTLLQLVRIYKSRYLRGIYRATKWDRICLRTINWLHTQHHETNAYPAVFADDDVSIIPTKGIPFYFFPCLEQQGLRFQPLFFHEFGHLLYKCHEQELDSLVGDFQQIVESELLPASQRNDQYAQEQARVRQSVVETWYKWIQEFFCDAVGLTIGGPCFLNAFSEYINKFQSSDYSRQPSDLHGSTHPISFLRMQLLVERAQDNGFVADAARVMEQWNQTASLLGVTHDHHGFYTTSLKSAVRATLRDMLVEVSARQCTGKEAAGLDWQAQPLNLVAVLNQVWLKYFEDPARFHEWESSLLEQIYDLRTQTQ